MFVVLWNFRLLSMFTKYMRIWNSQYLPKLWYFQAPRYDDVRGRGTKRRRVVSFTPRPLCRRYPLDRTLGGSQSRSGRCGEEKYLLYLSGTEIDRTSSP
jgi:hypothetical protein